MGLFLKAQSNVHYAYKILLPLKLFLLFFSRQKATYTTLTKCLLPLQVIFDLFLKAQSNVHYDYKILLPLKIFLLYFSRQKATYTTLTNHHKLFLLYFSRQKATYTTLFHQTSFFCSISKGKKRRTLRPWLAIKHYEAKKIEKPYRFLKCSKDLLTPNKT